MKWWREEQCRRVTRERKLLLRGKWENAISGQQMDNVRKEIHAVSAMSQRPGNGREAHKAKGRSSSPAANSKAKTDGEGEIPSKSSGNRGERPSGNVKTMRLEKWPFSDLLWGQWVGHIVPKTESVFWQFSQRFLFFCIAPRYFHHVFSLFLSVF